MLARNPLMALILHQLTYPLAKDTNMRAPYQDRRFVAAVLLVLGLGVSRANAEFIVAPTSATTFDNPASFNCLPLSTCSGAWTELHYQQVYDAANFGGASGMISSIAFREDMLGGGGDVFINGMVTIANSANS